MGQAAEDVDVGSHVVAFGRERLTEPDDVAPLVLEIRLAQLDVDLDDVGVDDHQPAEAHRRRLRDPQQLRHLANRVLVDPGLAAEAPARLDLGLAEEPVVVR